VVNTNQINLIDRVFRSDEDIDTQIKKAVEKTVKYLNVSFGQFIPICHDKIICCNSFVWCKNEFLQAWGNGLLLSENSLAMIEAILQEQDTHSIGLMSELPENLQEVLEGVGVLSFILTPIWYENSIKGIFIFSDCADQRIWSSEQVDTVEAIIEKVSQEYAKTILAERLASSEENFRTLFETIDDIIVVGDMQGNLIYGNPGTCKKLGYSLNELIGMHILELHPVRKRAEAERILNDMFHGKLSCCPLELQTKSGVIIPVETRIWFGKWNEQDCIFGISKDLSTEQAALQKFERLFRNNPAPMGLSRSEDRVFIDVNDAFIEKFGYSKEEVIGKSSSKLGIILDEHKWGDVRTQLAQTGHIHNIEFNLRKKDGGSLVGLFSGETINSQGENLFLTVMNDISPQVELQRKLEAEHARLSHIIEGTHLGTWEWNIVTGETQFNARWAEIIGYDLSELQPTTIDTWTEFCHPDDLAESERLLADHFLGKTEYYDYEARMQHKNGSWIWVLDRGKVIEWDADHHPLKMYGTHTDITERKCLEQQVKELSIRDPLTGVFNRRYIYQRLEEIKAEYSRKKIPFCISILDIDHFKKVNDRFGHTAGDVVLRKFSHLVISTIRQYDLLGRIGGEEFIIITFQATKSETVDMMERVRSKIRMTDFEYEKNIINITCSCGISECSEIDPNSFSIEEMMNLADRRLYKSKDFGRDIIVWQD
jgi:diguanylate cyclase (GGDEF)-like protein/PAS domain S-box-containing protein